MSLNIDGTIGPRAGSQPPTQTRPYDFGTDAIERQRVSLGQAMMDADFEYGLQATKWQSYVDVRKFPSFFEVPGTDYPVSNVVSDGAGPNSNITVNYTGTNTSANVNGFISMFGLSNQKGVFADRAEGYFIVTANTSTTANYIAKGVVPAGNVQSNFTFSRRANVYNGGTLSIPFTSILSDGTSNLQVYTSNAHGLLPGFPLTANNFCKSAALANAIYGNFFGTFFVSNVTSSISFNIVANTFTFGNVNFIDSNLTPANCTLYISQFASQQHRPYDGGVLLSTLSPAHGSTVCRQSKKAFRYQSGKGILFSSGTLFSPNLDIATATPSGPTTTVSGVPFLTSPIVMQVSSTSNLAVGQTIAGPIISGSSGLGAISNTMGILTISAVGAGTVTATFPGTYPQTLVPSNGLSISANATTKTTGTVLLSGAVNLPVTATTVFTVGSNISVLPASLGNATITNIGTAGSNLQFVFTGSWPATDISFGTVIPSPLSNATTTAYSPYLATIPITTATTSGTGFAAAQIISGLDPGFGTVTVSAVGGSSLSVTYTGTAAIPPSIASGLTLSNTATTVTTGTNLGTGTPIVLTVSPTTGFTAGMVITGLPSGYGVVTVSSIQAGTSLTCAYGGVTPTSIPATTAITGTASILTSGTTSTFKSPITLTTVAGSTLATGGGQILTGLNSAYGLVTTTAAGSTTATVTFTGATAAPLTIPAGVLLTSSVTSNGPPVETPSNNFSLVVASTLGFLPGQTINTYDAAGTTLKPFGAMNPVTINAIYTSNSTLSCNFLGTYSNITSGNTVTFRSSGLTLTSNIIPGGTTFTLPVAGTTGFAAGQTVTSLLGLNMGTISITGVTPASAPAGANLAMNFTGTWPTPNPIPLGTTVATLPAGSNLQIVTDVGHGIPTSGATATIRNFTTTAINGTGYTISTAIDSRTVNVLTQQNLTSGQINLGDQPRLVITNWHGSTVRAGCFEDPNGLFWEYDGQTLSVVRRQSTFTCAGYVTVSPQSQILLGTTPTNSFVSSGTTVTAFTTGIGETSNIFTMTGASPLHNITAGQYCQLPGLGYAWVVGATDFYQVTLGFTPTTSAVTITPAQILAAAFYTPTTRFQDQLKVNDRFTIRGMVHQVTSIQGQGVLTFNPPYRGAANITPATPVKCCKIKELRVPQTQFNRDTIDGKGPSGYRVDLSRQQMIALQYTWYGAGFVDFMIRGPDGNFIMCHRIKNNNVNDEAYMRSGNLPVRYELSVESRASVSSLAANITASQTTIPINDPTTPFPASGGTLLIDNELVYYTGTTATSFTGCTRAASLVYNVNDINRTFTGQAASTHLANTSVNLISCTATPTMTHWGSSFLTDGQFDTERGYYFNYSNTAVNISATSGTPASAFAIRLAPSVTNGLVGDIGVKELVNRAQLLLQKLEVTSTQSIQTIGYLNPTNVVFDPTKWLNVNNQGNGTQPSFTQYYTGDLLAPGFNPLPGERIFQTIVQQNNQNNLDLTGIKELTNSCIGGNRPFPDGPDVLLIFCQSLGVACTAQVNLFWQEAQA